MIPIRNILANLSGSSSIAAMGLFFTPVYLHFLGIEAYALVGFAIMLQAMSAVLDMGLSKTCNREMARMSCSTDFGSVAPDVLRTFELIYWSVAILLGVMIAFSASFISSNWLSYEFLQPDYVQLAVLLIGVNLALQWPVSIYSGGLLGLERHVLLNVILVACNLFRHVGASLLLWLYSPTIMSFLSWYILASIVQVLVLAVVLWRLISATGIKASPKFSLSVLKNVWRFSAGVAGVQIISVLITQIDKVMISKLVSLEVFGYYMLASVAATSIAFVVTPFSKAIFPRFAKLVHGDGSHEDLSKMYHQICILVTVIVVPIAGVGALFSQNILFVWTGDVNAATQGSGVFSLLIVAAGLNSFITIPYTLQLAYGWTSLSFNYNMVSLLLQIPLLVFFVSKIGVEGGVIPRLLHNFGYIFILVPVMHRKILQGEWIKWLWSDLLARMFPVLIFLMAIKFILDWPLGYWSQLFILISIIFFSVLLSMFSSLSVRQIFSYYFGLKERGGRP